MNSSQENTPREIKVVDDARRPRNWNELLAPTQCAAFFKRFDSEIPLSADGAPFANVRDTTFLLFERLDEARRFCEARVEKYPHMSCEIFDSEGKAKPPVLVIEHPRAAARDELSAGSVRKRRILAILLILGAPALFWWDHRANGTLVMPTFLGISMLLAAARLLHWNMARMEGMQQQEQRVQAHLLRERDSSGTSRR